MLVNAFRRIEEGDHVDMDKFVLSHGAAEIVLSDEYPGVTIKSQDLLRIRAEAKSATAYICWGYLDAALTEFPWTTLPKIKEVVTSKCAEARREVKRRD